MIQDTGASFRGFFSMMIFVSGGGGFGGNLFGDDPYVKRKELIKSGLLLGAGVLKGALITTLINNANNNNGK